MTTTEKSGLHQRGGEDLLSFLRQMANLSLDVRGDPNKTIFFPQDFKVYHDPATYSNLSENVSDVEDFNPIYPNDVDYGSWGGDGFGGGEDADQSMAFIVEGVVLTVVSVLGIMGTSLSIGVLVRPSVRESFSALLTGLAVCDTLFLATSLVLFGLPKLWMWFAENVISTTAVYIFGLLHIWRVGSTYLTLSVTLERYCAICRPLGTSLRQTHLLVVSLGFAVLYNLPKFFEFKTVYLANGEAVTGSSEMRKNWYYSQFYVFWSKFLLIELFPYFTIIVLNALILFKTMKASQFRSRFTQQTSFQSSHTLTTSAFSNSSRRPSSHIIPLRSKAVNGTQSVARGSTCATDDFKERDTIAIAAAMTTSDLCPGYRRERILSVGAVSVGNGSKVTTTTATTATTMTRSNRSSSINSPFLLQQQQRHHDDTSVPSIAPTMATAKTVSAGGKEKALGVTLIGVSVLFLSCQSLKLIPDVYEFICDTEYCESNPVIDTLISLSNLLMCINSAANFLMYMVRGTKFRRAFIRTYAGCLW